MLHFNNLWDAHPTVRNEHPTIDHKNAVFGSESAVWLGVALSKCKVDTTQLPGVEHSPGKKGEKGQVLRAEELALGLKNYPILGLQPSRIIDPENVEQQLRGQTGIIFIKGFKQVRKGDKDTLIRFRPGDHIDLWNGHQLTGKRSLSSLLPQNCTADLLRDWDRSGVIWFWDVDRAAHANNQYAEKKAPVSQKKKNKKKGVVSKPKTSQSSQSVEEKQNNLNRQANDSPKCVEMGHPVNAITGAVVETVTDFSVNGRIPLVWQRHYCSQKQDDSLLGLGWQCPADARLTLDKDDHVIVHYGTKTASVFPRLPDQFHETVSDPSRDYTLHQNNTHYIVSGKNKLSFHFSKITDKRTVYLEKITDTLGNALSFQRDGHVLNGITDSAGLHVRVTSEHGRIREMVRVLPDGQEDVLVTYGYSPDNGDLISVTDITGVALAYGYTNHCLTRLTFRSGLTFHYEYDETTPKGRAIRTWGDEGLYHYRFEYNDMVRQTHITNSLGHTEIIIYNEAYKPVAVIDHAGHETAYTYNSQNKPLSVTDPLGRKSVYEYDGKGNLVSVVRPDGSRIAMEYDGNGNPVTIIDPNGNPWRQRFDSRSLLTARISPVGSETNYEYNPRGDLISVTAPNGGITQLGYDDNGHISAITHADGSIERFERDILGNVTAAYDPLGRKTEYVYDEARRLIRIIKPSGGVISCTYDAENRLTTYTDEAGHTTRLSYTGIDRLKTRTNPDGTNVHYHYDTEERLKTLTNERGEIYEFKRDHAGRITREIDYWGNERAYTYDPAGQLLKSIDPLNRITVYTTDALGRLIEKTFENGNRETFSFDANGNLTAHENEHALTERIFDAENRLTLENINGRSTIHEYDVLGNRTRRVSALGNDIRYEYDILGRVSGISINGAEMAIIRNELGLPVKESFANGTERTYDYTPDNQLSDQIVVLPHGNTIKRSYEYDPVGNLVARIDADKGSRYFTYNPMGRITQYIDPEQKIKDFLHDPAGDLLKHTDKEEFDGSRHVSHDGTDYHFDAAGNLIERTGKRGQHTFSWDENNRLTSATNTGTGVRTQMAYDAQGRRLSKTTGAQTTTFLWDGDQLLSDNIGGTNEREFVYYPGSFEPLAIIDQNQTINLIHTDSVGLPHEVTNESGDLVWSASYNAQGAVETLHVSSFDNPIRMQGQYYDPEIDLAYNRYRYFDAKVGSYVSQDLLGLAAGSKIYDYSPNVWGWVDPFGLSCSKAPGDVQKLKYTPTSGQPLIGTSGKTTTILGNYQMDMQHVIDEMGNVKSLDFGPKPGGFNVLNVPDHLYENPNQFWNDFNKPWLDQAITRNDEFIFATKPDMQVLKKLNPATGKYELSGFGKEYLYLRQKGMASKITY